MYNDGPGTVRNMNHAENKIDSIIAELQAASASTTRPKIFIRGTCSCEECMEHDQTMQTFQPDSLPLGKLCNPGWDPICFASNQAFVYFLPGLARLVLENPDAYMGQLVFHLGQPERFEVLTASHADALIKLLDYLVLEKTLEVEINLVEDAVFDIRSKLEKLVDRNNKSRV